MEFILASQSPVRKKILTDLGHEFRTVSSNTEEVFEQAHSISHNALRLALQKATAVQKKFPEDIVVGSDSIMASPEERLLEKPKNRDDAFRIFSDRSGGVERIISAVAVLYQEKVYQGYEETLLQWRDFSREDIDRILDTGEWKGKCGGVMVEGISGLFLKKIEGSLVNIMGLPYQKFLEGMQFISSN